MLQNLFRNTLPGTELPPGVRLYAIGDVHGRLDLVRELLARIEEDGRARGRVRPTLVFLGDLIDRGPDSAGVIDLMINRVPWANLLCLRGNHEAAMLDALAGDRRAARMWIEQGGLEALASWGVPLTLLHEADIEAIIDAARAIVPEAHRRWIARLPISYRIGDYLFVHAGVRPGIPLERQLARDTIWIREPFLHSRLRHGAYVIHGHSISEEVEQHPNRTGIDTGAYASGRLSAIGLEGQDRWILQTNAAEKQG